MAPALSSPSSPNMSSLSLSPNLPPTHPLISELQALRQQLAQFQKSAHQSAIQLQGARLELALAKEESKALRDGAEGMKAELGVLRANPAPPPLPLTTTSLSELTLAHRRLSTKLDLTESSLSASQLELASAKQEIHRMIKERDGDRAVINSLRRKEEEGEEELDWERGERRRAEEGRKLLTLALDEYKKLIQELDPNAVPPAIPSKASQVIQLPVIIPDPPAKDSVDQEKPLPALSSTAITARTDDAAADSAQQSRNADSPKTRDGHVLELVSDPQPDHALNSSSSGEIISNLLIGQRGVNRLFEDFTSTLSSKQKEVYNLQIRVEELEHTLATLTSQLASETHLRTDAESERDKVLRDDASAAKVVERYMTFTQKTHATVHLHLNNLRARSNATQSALRKEIIGLRTQYESEASRAERMRVALDEASESLSREMSGRRREVGLRLKMIGHEEKKERAIEKWLDRVRIARAGAEGAVLEADTLEILLDEGIEAVTVDKGAGAGADGNDVTRDKLKSWRGFLGRKRAESNAQAKKLAENAETNAQSSLARVALAEELVDILVKDLQAETERRMELEKQRVEWLARHAADGHSPGDHVEPKAAVEKEVDHVVFEIGDDEDHDDAEHDTSEKATAPLATQQVPITTANTPSDESPREVPLQETTNGDGTTTPGLVRPPDAEIELLAPPPLESPGLIPDPSSEAKELKTLFAPLELRYQPLQKSLHDLSLSLTALRQSLPAPSNGSAGGSATASSPVSVSPTTSFSNIPGRPGKKTFLPMRKPLHPMSDPYLLTILDNLHESIEDARVDVEIALADEDRVYRGFEALLGVGSVVQSSEVVKDAKEYLEDRVEGDGKKGLERLEGKVRDLEEDLGRVKAKLHEIEGMDLTLEVEDGSASPQENGNGKPSRKVAIWEGMSLKSITPVPPPLTSSSSFFSSSLDALSPTDKTRSGTGAEDSASRRPSASVFTNVTNVGRSFSASVIGAPRKVSGIAGGLYRPGRKKSALQKEEEEKAVEETHFLKAEEEDEVE